MGMSALCGRVYVGGAKFACMHWSDVGAFMWGARYAGSALCGAGSLPAAPSRERGPGLTQNPQVRGGPILGRIIGTNTINSTSGHVAP